jgi:hypothetical protein
MRLRPQLTPTRDRFATSGNLLISNARTPAADDDAPVGQDAAYRFDTVSLVDAVDRCVSGWWDMPDFQRGFVWKPYQSAMLFDSLWRNYPTGFVLLWTAPPGTQDQDSRSWIADGQQRLTSLCLLFGKRPRWWGRRPEPEWGRVTRRYDIRFDIEGAGFSRFLPEHKAMDENRFIPMPRILANDPNTAHGRASLQAFASRAKSAGHAERLTDEEVFARLVRVAELRDKTLLLNSVSHEFRDVLEIFDRLNSRGIRFRWLMMRIMREAISAALGRAQDRAMHDFRDHTPA